jgi:hypothetical protein
LCRNFLLDGPGAFHRVLQRIDPVGLTAPFPTAYGLCWR